MHIHNVDPTEFMCISCSTAPSLIAGLYRPPDGIEQTHLYEKQPLPKNDLNIHQLFVY